MSESPSEVPRYLTPAQVAELLSLSVEDVIALVHEGRLHGAQLGSTPQWRIEADSVNDYLDDQTEIARRTALWHQSETASFPEVWGRSARQYNG